MLKKAFQIIFSVLSNILTFLGGQAKKLNLKKSNHFLLPELMMRQNFGTKNDLGVW